MSILTAIVDVHSVAGVIAGAVAAVTSSKVYAYVTKQTKSVEARVAALEAKVAADVKAKV